MVYGYVVIESEIYNDIDSDYQDSVKSAVHKVRLFANEKDRDSAVDVERRRNSENGWNNIIEKFVTKEEQGGLIIQKIKK